MGTAAVFAIGYTNENGEGRFITNPILGMTSDGFPNNLEWLAERYKAIQGRIRIANKHAHKGQNIARVLRVIEDQNKDWAFIDDLRNASWVTHSAIWYPETSVIRHYCGSFEDPVCSRRFRAKKWTETWRNEYMYSEMRYERWLEKKAS